MFTAREIWEAGRKALGIPTAPTPAAIADSQEPALAREGFDFKDRFDPLGFDFEDREYRVTFKNGCSNECNGLALKHNFCFDVSQIEKIEPVEEVGLGL